MDRLQTAPVDVAIIGGGIQGAGIAREAALRGLSVALFEKGDFAGGTSSRTSHLIHGGIRYLEQGALRLVHKAVHERFRLTRLAPHLVRPTPFLFPIYRGEGKRKWKIQIGMFLYDLLAGSETVGRHRMLSAAEALAQEPGLRSEGLLGAARFYDCRMEDARLCLATLLSARESGAAIFNYAAVTGLIQKNGKVSGVRVKERFTRAEYDVFARVVVNASGPWVDEVCRMEGGASRRLRPTKGSHIIVQPVTRKHAVVISSEKDQRIFFVIPWKGMSLIGTTDLDYTGDLDRVRVEEGEVGRLLEETGRIFPKSRFTKEDVIAQYAGVRPLIYEGAEKASDISREGRLEWTSSGMLNLVGGKFTLFRKTGQKGVDAILKREPTLSVEPRPEPEPPIYGGEIGLLADFLREEIPRARERYRIGDDALHYLIGAYGSKYHDLLYLARADKFLLKPLTPSGYPLLVEVIYAVRHEMAVRLSDFLRRRTALSLGPFKRDLPLINQVAEKMGKELGWDRERTRTEIDDYLKEVE